jgi:hypothetical protein
MLYFYYVYIAVIVNVPPFATVILYFVPSGDDKIIPVFEPDIANDPDI